MLEKDRSGRTHFQSLTGGIDTTTSAGWMMMHLIGSFAEFERALLRERTRADSMKRTGRIGGRRPKLTKGQQQEMIALVTSGQKSAADVARMFRVHPTKVSQLIARYQAFE